MAKSGQPADPALEAKVEDAEYSVFLGRRNTWATVGRKFFLFVGQYIVEIVFLPATEGLDSTESAVVRLHALGDLPSPKIERELLKAYLQLMSKGGLLNVPNIEVFGSGHRTYSSISPARHSDDEIDDSETDLLLLETLNSFEQGISTLSEDAAKAVSAAERRGNDIDTILARIRHTVNQVGQP